MRRTTQRTRRPTRALVATMVLAVTLLVGVDLGTGAVAQTPPYELGISQRENLLDGQQIEVDLRAPAGSVISASSMRICRDGEVYDSADDLNFLRGNCPNVPISSSASPAQIARLYPSLDAAVARFRVGTGTAAWGPPPAPELPPPFSLTCDPTHPCLLVWSFRIGSQTYVDSSIRLTFASSDAISACGGSDPNLVRTTGPDRLTQTWIDLTRTSCQQTGALAPTQAVLGGEGEGLLALQIGLSDLSYSAVGSRFGTGEPLPHETVSVPLGLNGVVVGVLGGYPTTDPDYPRNLAKPFDDIKMTPAELATLFGNSPQAFTEQHRDAIFARNPQLAEAQRLTSVPKDKPLAAAGSDASSWFASTLFHDFAPLQWRTSPVPLGDNTRPNTPRGIHDAFAQADPPFSVGFMELYSAQGSIKRVAIDAETATEVGPVWILTDRATAAQFDIPTVAIQNTSGNFVAPTDASLLAALQGMQLQSDGTYLPTVGGGSIPDAYPLAFVEHAVVRTEPLVDEECAPRTETQAILAGWLAFLTGGGQQVLADGIVPLTPELAAQAATAKALVGTAALTGDCAPAAPPVPEEGEVPPPVPPGAAELPSSSFDPPSVPSGVSSPSRSNPSGGLGVNASGSPVDGGAPVDTDGDGVIEADEVAIAEIAYPDPTDIGGGNGLATGLAIIVLATLVGLGGFLSSGRRLPRPGGRS